MNNSRPILGAIQSQKYSCNVRKHRTKTQKKDYSEQNNATVISARQNKILQIYNWLKFKITKSIKAAQIQMQYTCTQ